MMLDGCMCRLLVVLSVVFFSPAAAQRLIDVPGRVAFPGDAPVTARPSMAIVRLYTSTGQKIQSFCDVNGAFTLVDVPPGAHLLQVDMMGFLFPEVRLDVSKNGVTRATYTQNRQQVIPSPLVIYPAGEISYFEARKPINVMSFVKSPYGMMIIFSLFAIFVFPMLKVDPEEYKEFQKDVGSMLGKGESESKAITGGSKTAVTKKQG